jgi:hypothetical protein
LVEEVPVSLLGVEKGCVVVDEAVTIIMDEDVVVRDIVEDAVVVLEALLNSDEG